VSARSSLKQAPRDIQQLECLRQAKHPSMSERYDAAVEKENTEWTSLIAAAAAEGGNKNKDDDMDSDEEKVDVGDDEVEQTNERKQKNKRKQKKEVDVAPPAPEEDEVLMGMQDDVEEGVDWSSDEE